MRFSVLYFFFDRFCASDNAILITPFRAKFYHKGIYSCNPFRKILEDTNFRLFALFMESRPRLGKLFPVFFGVLIFFSDAKFWCGWGGRNNIRRQHNTPAQARATAPSTAKNPRRIPKARAFARKQQAHSTAPSTPKTSTQPAQKPFLEFP